MAFTARFMLIEAMLLATLSEGAAEHGETIYPAPR